MSGLRRQRFPIRSETEDLARRLLSLDAKVLIPALEDLDKFARALLKGSIQELAHITQPVLLSLDQPCSWTSAIYLATVTNPTHNPVCVVARHWLEGRFPNLTWHGWPQSRSLPLTRYFSNHSGRVQWQLVGIDSGGHVGVLAEVRSITANNWGNKSKELYDRVDETRRSFSEVAYTGITLGILDGDFDANSLVELAQKGYDEVHSVQELLAEWHDRQARPEPI